MPMRKCIKCYKDINEELEWCPKCGQRQFFGDTLEALYGKPKVKFKQSKVKKKSVFSTAEVYTALNKNDSGYLAYLATKLFGG